MLNYSPSFLWKRGIVPIWLLNSSLSLFFLLLSGNGRTWARRTWSTWRRCSATTWPRTTRSSRSPSSSRSCRRKTWVFSPFIGSKKVFHNQVPAGQPLANSRGALRCEFHLFLDKPHVISKSRSSQVQFAKNTCAQFWTKYPIPIQLDPIADKYSSRSRTFSYFLAYWLNDWLTGWPHILPF